MKSIYELKPAFQNSLKPIVNTLHQKGITANQVTLSAVALSFIMGGLISLHPNNRLLLLLIPIVLLVRMALNAIDGMLAREFHQQSSLGLILNELGDVFSDAFIYLPFCLISGVSSIVIVWLVLLATISEMAGVIAIQLSGSRRYDGPMGKSDRAFAFSVMSILLALGLKSHSIINFLFIVIMVLLIATIYNRCKKALQETKAVT